jgi:mannose-1-phosphate guanylyltransferase
MVLNGDVLTDLDLTALQGFHVERESVATLGLYPVSDPLSYGLVRRRDSGEVTEFLEKPEPEQVNTDEINAGAYVLERAVADLIPPGRSVSIEREVFPRLVGQGLFGLRLEGYWMDIGTPERYLAATWDILEGRVETDVQSDGSGTFVAVDASVDPGATVGPRAMIGAGGRVAAGSTVAGSALLEGCSVGEGAEVRAAILGAAVEIGRAARVMEGAVIGDAARIADGATVEAGARVAPEEVVSA